MIDRYLILMRREMWENRIGFVWAPLVLGAIVLILMFMSMFMVHQIDSQNVTTSDAIRMFAQADSGEKVQVVRGGLLGIQVFFNIVMFFVTVFYLLGALYDDRKDRSILFWKSLPISDTTTVFSKLASGALFIPVIFLGATIITQLGVMLGGSGYLLTAGVSLWDNLWGPASLLSTWGVYILAMLLQSVWLLPIYGWLLLCSAFAPRLPLLFAIGIPLVISWIQSYVNIIQSFDFKARTVMHFFGERLSEGVLPLSLRASFGSDEDIVIGLNGGSEAQALQDYSLSLRYLVERLTDIELWFGLAIGAVFIVAAIYLRRRATDQ